MTDERVEHKDVVAPVYKPLRAADLDKMHQTEGWTLMGLVYLQNVSLYQCESRDNIIYYVARKVRG